MNGKSNIKDILVYATPYQINAKQWGYKWVGFYKGKRLLVMQKPDMEELYMDIENGIYMFTTTEQKKSIPREILTLMYSSPLSNHYFIMEGKGKFISMEVVMILIENGHDINNIVMQPYLRCFNKDCRNKSPYLCRYINKNTNKIIAEIVDVETVLWA